MTTSALAGRVSGAGAGAWRGAANAGPAAKVADPARNDRRLRRFMVRRSFEFREV
jgi:hypothetical protein